MTSDENAVFRYALLMRPPAPGALPGNGLIHVSFMPGKTASGHHYWGIAHYDRQLTKDELEHYDMEEC